MEKEVKKTSKRNTKIELPVIKNYVIQSNTVTNAINNFTLYQERVLNAIIYKLQEAITYSRDGKNYNQLSLFQNDAVILAIPLKDISEAGNYPKVKEAIKKMSVSQVYFSYTDEKGKKMNYTSGLFSATLPEKGNGGGEITVKIERIVADLLIRIQKDTKGNPIQYTRFMYEIAQSVKTPYASKLYKLISSWKKKGGFYISKDDLYKKLGIAPGEYESNYDFIRRIIKPAHDQLFEKSDCWFNYATKDFVVKEGGKAKGKVLGYNFKIITPEFEKVQEAKVEVLIRAIRVNFNLNDEAMASIMPIFTADDFDYFKVSNKVTELHGKIFEDSSIIHKGKYFVSSFLKEFIDNS